MLKNHKNILYILIAIIVLFFGYWYFVLSKRDEPSSNSNSLVAKTPGQQGVQQSGQSQYDQEFVSSLQAIRYIDLNTTILQSPAYKALSFPERPFQVDYNIPVGRRNPFLPIGVGQDIGTSNIVQEEEEPVATTTPSATTTRPTPRR